MNNRRRFFRDLALGTALLASPKSTGAVSTPAQVKTDTSRRFWIETLERVAGPVLTHGAANTLRNALPVEARPGHTEERRKFASLEALGRTLAGIAPWLALHEDARSERWAGLARQAIAHATDPAAPDFMNFTTRAQPLVDAAFLVQGLLRAKTELWEKLPPEVQTKVVAALQGVRKIKPGHNNWLLFSAMVETFLASVGAEWNEAPIELALRSHEQWYLGDGTYGDGPELHWDYYNSYVIQPFLIDILDPIGKVTPKWDGLKANVLRRAQRYAAVQERLIAPDGTYPVLGRSMAYRCGAFQTLAQIALRHELPEELSPAPVRCALGTVIHRTLGAPGTFDAEGWLRIGVCGNQPDLAESYICTGSLYLCTVAFLPLGLPAADPFWSDAEAPWTAQRVWSGQNLPADHALKLSR